MTEFQKLQKDFVDLRLGSFIHFNSATVQFHSRETEDWEFGVENGGQARRFPFDPKDWNPVNLDPESWAKTIKSSGGRFAALTTKHHEGFCLWDSAYTEHCVRNATLKTDVVAAYLDACRKEGLVAGLYFSVLDLTSGLGRAKCTEEHKKMVKGQITELLTNYGEIPFLIVDGWNAPWGGPSYHDLPFEEIDALVKSLQPHCLLMNIGCTEGIKGTDIIFYENGAGQDVKGSFSGPGILCQKLTNTWFSRFDDGVTPVKKAEWVHALMKKYYPMNIALIMNLSPLPDGTLNQNQVEEFARIGEGLTLPEPIATLPEGWLSR
ncbi:MAG: alpha-L-fucosidase [Eubacteriales bacterium]